MKNLELKEKIKWVTITVSKGKNKVSSLQLELENKMHTVEMNMIFSLKGNLVL